MSSKSAKRIAVQKPRNVVLAVVGRAKVLDIAGPLQVFADARFDDGHPAYKVVLASEVGGAIPTDGGVAIASVRLKDVPISDIETF